MPYSKLHSLMLFYPSRRMIRSCPGLDLAEQTLWLAAASLVTIFEFETPENEKANYIGPDGKVDPRFDPGFLGCVPAAPRLLSLKCFHQTPLSIFL